MKRDRQIALQLHRPSCVSADWLSGVFLSVVFMVCIWKFFTER